MIRRNRLKSRQVKDERAVLHTQQQQRRSLGKQFQRDYYKISLAPVVLFFVLAMVVLTVTNYDAQNQFQKLVANFSRSAQLALQEAGEKYIREKAYSVASAVEIYLRDHAYVTMSELQNRPEFLSIAIQNFEQSGYTAMYEAGTSVVRFHPDPSLMDQDLSDLAAQLPRWWQIFNVPPEGAVAAGYYDWIRADGTTVEKYMVVVPVGIDFQGTTLMVAATIEARELYSDPVIHMREDISSIAERTVNLVSRGRLVLGIVGILTIIAVIFVVRSQAQQAVTRYIFPIEVLEKTATELGEGRWRNATYMELLSRMDEIGSLAQAFVEGDTRIRDLVTNLEQTVQERTRGLQVAAEISQATTLMDDPDILMSQAVNLVQERFDLYYVGIFLLDETRQWINLRAGTGKAGRQMLESGHKFGVDSDSMIATCVRTGQPQIPRDIDEAEVRFVNPLLPDTQSEIALPLRARGEVIGAMTVQSDQAGAFDDADIAIFQTVGDEVAVAIENAHLYAASQDALAAMRRAYGEFTREAWIEMLQQQETLGYQVDDKGLIPLSSVGAADGGGSQDTMADSGPSLQEPFYEVPIRVRGAVIGTLEVSKPEGTVDWTEGDRRQLETLAVQLGIALDSARQFEETQWRAERERMVSTISTRIAQTLDVETMLRAAVQELGQLPGVAEATVHLGTTNDSNPSPTNGGTDGSLTPPPSPLPARREGKRPPASEGIAEGPDVGVDYEERHNG